MSDIINLSNLRELTDGDKKLEASLFQEFFSCSEKLINDLKTAYTAHDVENWRVAAHALKGASYNLGAQKLGDYCKQAQENHTAAPEQKEILLDSITSLYGQVKENLKKEIY